MDGIKFEKRKSELLLTITKQALRPLEIDTKVTKVHEGQKCIDTCLSVASLLTTALHRILVTDLKTN